MILDTSVIVEKVRNNEIIEENITSISLIEYPPIIDYEYFKGEIYFINERDQITAFSLQIKLRNKGVQMNVENLLIASICINRGEKLLTMDKDFLVIKM